MSRPLTQVSNPDGRAARLPQLRTICPASQTTRCIYGVLYVLELTPLLQSMTAYLGVRPIYKVQNSGRLLTASRFVRDDMIRLGEQADMRRNGHHFRDCGAPPPSCFSSKVASLLLSLGHLTHDTRLTMTAEGREILGKCPH